MLLSAEHACSKLHNCPPTPPKTPPTGERPRAKWRFPRAERRLRVQRVVSASPLDFPCEWNAHSTLVIARTLIRVSAPRRNRVQVSLADVTTKAKPASGRQRGDAFQTSDRRGRRGSSFLQTVHYEGALEQMLRERERKNKAIGTHKPNSAMSWTAPEVMGSATCHSTSVSLN